MKSIMHNKKDRTCYLCMMLHGDDSMKEVLQEHHVFRGNANREMSERYGLKVYLCLNHHLTSTEAVHRNRKVEILLWKEGKRAFQKKYPDIDFMKIFSRSYLTDEDGPRQQACGKQAGAAGVQRIDGIQAMDERWEQ